MLYGVPEWTSLRASFPTKTASQFPELCRPDPAKETRETEKQVERFVWVEEGVD